MKSNQVSVLVVLLLCLVMGGFLYVVDRSSDDEKGWSPSELYGELGARSYEGSSFSDVTFSGGASSDGVAVSMRNGSFSLRTRARHASSPNSLVANGGPGKSVDFLGALSPNRPIASSPSVSGGGLISHMTSSAEFHSFGGGSNMAMGSYTSSSTSLIASSPAIGSYSQLPIAYNPIASSPNNLIAYSPSNGEVQVAAEQALMSASSSASGLFGSAMQNTYGTATYDEYLGKSGSKPSGVRGRQNAGPYTPTVEESWLIWLSQHTGYGSSGEDGWYFDKYQLHAAWEAYCEAWNETMGPCPTWEEWLSWFTGGDGSHTWGSGDDAFFAHFVPVGSILPLILMALMYMIILFIKRNKTAQL